MSKMELALDSVLEHLLEFALECCIYPIKERRGEQESELLY